MDKILEIIGNVAAVAGILTCLIAGVARIGGSYHLLGFEAVTLFIGGISLMLMGCLAKLQQMSMK